MKKIVKSLILTCSMFGFSLFAADDANKITKHNGYFAVGGVSGATDWTNWDNEQDPEALKTPLIPEQKVSLQGGYRYQKGYLGYDVGLASVVQDRAPIIGHGKLLCFPMPTLKTQPYIGFGLSAERRLFELKSPLENIYSTEVTIGSNFQTRWGKTDKFVQLNLRNPFKLPNQSASFNKDLASLTLNYGVLF